MNTEKRLYQWDTGQKLVGCTGLYVDFPIDNEIYRVETVDGMCIIPDELLQTSGSHKVYECMTNNTIRSFAFNVTPRPQPPDYVFTPTERLTFEGLVQKVDDAVADMIRRADSGEFDGRTPVKGTDYFTASEIQQIQNEVSSGAIGEFKSVVDTETDKFNANATEQVNVYNQNGSEKTASYNTNATEKLNAYNTNAESKRNAYNTNASNKVAEYNTNAKNKTAEFDTHTEQIQTDISELKSDLGELIYKEYAGAVPNYSHPNKYISGLANEGIGDLYTNFLLDSEGANVKVYECKNGDEFKITGVYPNGNFRIAIPLTNDLKLVAETNWIKATSFSNNVQTNEIVVNCDCSYILCSSRSDLSVEKKTYVKKVPTIEEFEALKGNIPETYIHVNSLNLYDFTKSSVGLLASATVVNPNDAYFVSDYISVKSGTYIIQTPYESTKTVRIVHALYDTNKNEIVGSYTNEISNSYKVINITEDGYIRFSTYADIKSTVMFLNQSEVSPEYIPYEDYDKVNDVYQTSNPLWNKKWAVCGDSFTYGAYAQSDFKHIENGRYKGQNYTYAYLIGNRNNMEIQNLSMNGRTMATPSTTHTSSSFSDGIYQTIDEDVDYITIYLGINDSHHAPNGSAGDGEDNTGVIPVGTIDDTTINTFYGAWNVVMSWILENRPYAHVGIIVTNGCGSETYRNAEIEIARKYGVPFIDMNGDDRTPCMLRSDNPDISESIRNMKTRIMSVDYDGTKYGEGANWHPNEKAHEFESWFIEDFLRSL